MVLAQPAELVERGPHPPAVGVDEGLIEKERRRLSVAADDARQRDPFE